jgi:hypothetical protein
LAFHCRDADYPSRAAHARYRVTPEGMAVMAGLIQDISAVWWLRGSLLIRPRARLSSALLQSRSGFECVLKAFN